ncbi:DsrE family protein [Variovorax terrae]|uniref:DsrE family protein n=1 Tax=Variovorax terrae TaxID=2923278 RepID=A0A9X1VV14_9BURK|nr:DsrE family protein [Variovorax terrae]MCJ0763902.1 DsrE family protein [Variovorax terrae]
MNRRLFIQAAAATASATLLIAAQAQGTGTSGTKRHKIVIQMSDADPGKWNLALNNAKNLQDDVGATNVDIEIVAYGPGIGMLKLESPVASRVDDAVKAGVKVLACENTMRGQKLTKDDMNGAVGYVPAGVTEIMKKQAEGWAYLRP